MSEDDLRHYIKMMESHGIKIVFDTEEKLLSQYDASALFLPDSRTVVLSKSITYLDAIHEAYHVKQFLEIEKRKFIKQGMLNSEQYVYDQIMKNKDKFTNEEIEFSKKYIWELRRDNWTGFEKLL